MGFDVTADAYASFMGRFSEPLAPQLVDLLEPAPGDRALDVGCGPGTLTAVLAGRLGADRLAAVDPSPSFVLAVRALLPEVDVRDGAAEELPFGDEVFDLATAQLVVPFMADPVRGLSEMRRVVRPGGNLLFVSHFAAENGSLWWLERGLAPASRALGWHPDFAMEALFGPEDLACVTATPAPPFGIFKLVRLKL